MSGIDSLESLKGLLKQEVRWLLSSSCCVLLLHLLLARLLLPISSSSSSSFVTLLSQNAIILDLRRDNEKGNGNFLEGGTSLLSSSLCQHFYFCFYSFQER